MSHTYAFLNRNLADAQGADVRQTRLALAGIDVGGISTKKCELILDWIGAIPKCE